MQSFPIVILGGGVVALTHKNHECQVVLGSGNKVPTDFVVAGIEAIQSMELFHRTALDTSDGIKVNKFLETSVPGIWAAGDIANCPDQKSTVGLCPIVNGRPWP